jgi:hypothetical protein
MEDLLRAKRADLERLPAAHAGERPRTTIPRLKRLSTSLSGWLDVRRDNRQRKSSLAAIEKAVSLAPTPSAMQEIDALTGRG